MDGLLLVDKPQDWTSFDVVNKVRGTIARATGVKPRSIKVGHTGTLDPKATGLLVLAIGKGTKRIQELTKQDKSYLAEINLGQTSTTDDSEGEKRVVSDHVPERQTIEVALRGFIGEQQQVPPAFSAIKVNGKRAYKMARKGDAPQLKPRTVTVHDITNVEYDYPVIRCEISVSSGTYIRSLARDMGEKLETGAYLSGLRRSKVGNWRVQDAIPVQGVDMEMIQNALLPLD